MPNCWHHAISESCYFKVATDNFSQLASHVVILLSLPLQENWTVTLTCRNWIVKSLEGSSLNSDSFIILYPLYYAISVYFMMSRWSRKLIGSVNCQKNTIIHCRFETAVPGGSSAAFCAGCCLRAAKDNWFMGNLLFYWVRRFLRVFPRFWHGIFLTRIYFSQRLCKGQMYSP